MKKMFLFFLLVPFIGIGQTPTVVSIDRVFAKSDKGTALETAIGSHAQKYHTGSWKWRVYEISTGPDAGGLQLVEGPNTWATLDNRGNISKDHTADWDRTVAPLVTDKGSSMMIVFNDELSTVKLTDYADNIIVSHIFPKPGMVDRFKDQLKKSKATWTAGNESVAVYEAFASGAPQIIIVTRLKNGLKELEKGFRPPFKDRYNTANGATAYDDYLKMYSECVDKRWSEMLKYRPDLSSK